jgi:serine/threonine protein kinase
MDNQFLPNHFQLKNKYQIIKVLGQGGFGITYLAEDIILGTRFCIKELFVSGSSIRSQNMTVLTQNLKEFSFADFKERFLQEAKQLARFNHYNIVRVIDYFEANNTAYVVMEYIKGKTLKELVASKGPISFQESNNIIAQLLTAVEIVHNAGMLHRDIKPDNLIITEDGRVVLIDFGSARAFAEGKTVAQTAFVSPGYAPLEQYNPNARKGTYTDIYSIGATFYFMLTGHKPLNVTERYTERLIAPHELNKSVSIQVSSAVMLAMEMKAEDRFQNVNEFREAVYMLSVHKTVDVNKNRSTSNNDLQQNQKVNSSKNNNNQFAMFLVLAIVTAVVVFFFMNNNSAYSSNSETTSNEEYPKTEEAPSDEKTSSYKEETKSEEPKKKIVQEPTSNSYTGYLKKNNGEKIPIFVELYEENGRFVGRYHYRGKPWLRLNEVNRTYNEIIVHEYNDDDIKTGVFTLDIFDSSSSYLTGNFVAFDISYTVTLNKDK